MTDLNTLERHAFIRGDTALADLYDRAAMLDEIDIDTFNEVAKIGLDKIKKTEYKRGKKDASDELLQEIAELKINLEQIQKNFNELLTARLESWLRKWSTP